MKNLLKKVLAFGKFLKSRSFAVSVLSIILAVTVFQISKMANAIYIRDGEDVTLKFSLHQQDVDEILKDEGIVTMAFDVVDFSGYNGKLAEINIQRAFPVKVTADGTTQEVMMIDGLVEDALLLAGVSMDSNDLINLAPEKPVEAGDEIVVQRVDYVTVEEYEEIPFEVVTKETSLYRTGYTRVTQQGQAGEKTLTYEERTVDGVPQERQLVGEYVSKKPVNHEVLVGARVAISPLDFGYSFDQNGAPIGYTNVFYNQRATGYSARPGARTASGRQAIVGHVAVNPNEIPYGSKLYITSADGSFIYGYAIAADTGTGLLADVVDIDLFYDTYLESCLNGLRNVNIYVLG